MYHNQMRFASGMKDLSNPQESINYICYIYRKSQKSIFRSTKLDPIDEKYNAFSIQWLQDELFQPDKNISMTNIRLLT